MTNTRLLTFGSMVLGILLGLLLIVALWLVPDQVSEEEIRFNKRLVAWLATDQDVFLRDLTDFPWRGVCPVDSYLPKSIIERDSGIKFSVTDHWRWFWFAPTKENRTALIFITADGILPIKTVWDHDVHTQILGYAAGAKNWCDHGVNTKLRKTECGANNDPRASKTWCDISLISTETANK